MPSRTITRPHDAIRINTPLPAPLATQSKPHTHPAVSGTATQLIICIQQGKPARRPSIRESDIHSRIHPPCQLCIRLRGNRSGWGLSPSLCLSLGSLGIRYEMLIEPCGPRRSVNSTRPIGAWFCEGREVRRFAPPSCREGVGGCEGGDLGVEGCEGGGFGDHLALFFSLSSSLTEY